MTNTVRCAIYTRKSTEDGLEKEFNTLEAQREAGSSYIKSQKHQGWIELAKRYDDGGFSGGSLERPALRKLLEDVEDDKIDMIVVYKIDRLTRSLLDFSKLIEVLDKHHCSFVSVTQNFNTYDSMGRLTLNVLLSFAQFEREVITERIRDKVAASKKKGMWMGGTVPLGYDVIDKKLIINEKEAKIVRFIFEQYHLHQSELYVVNLLREKGIRGKKRILRDGTELHGGYIKHTRLSNMLKNPIYMGKVPYKDMLYDGQHKAIISEKLFEEVQEIKHKNWHARLSTPRFEEGALLKGLIYSGFENIAMVSTKSNKNNKIYQYYTSLWATKEGYRKCQLGSVPADEIENFIFQKIKPILQSPKVISSIMCEITSQDENVDINKVVVALNKDYDAFISTLDVLVQKQILRFLIQKIQVFKDHIVIIYTPLAAMLLPQEIKKEQSMDIDNTVQFDICFGRSYKGHRKIFNPGAKNNDDGLFALIVKAFQWQETLNKQHVKLDDLASSLGLSRGYVGKVVKLTCLSPEIIQRIYDGDYPDTCKTGLLLESEIPLLWSEQKIKYGFA